MADETQTPNAGRTAWARNLATPVRDFLGTETGSALVLVGAVIAALLWANVDFGSYSELWETHLSIQVGSHGINNELRAWVNEGLMTLFFLVVGLEAKREIDLGELRDPQKDSDRVKKPEWLIVVGVCTHLGCIPLGQKATDDRGPYGGWFCPCHGSIYDTSGRIRQGPAPANLVVPPYAFGTDTTIKIG